MNDLTRPPSTDIAFDTRPPLPAEEASPSEGRSNAPPPTTEHATAFVDPPLVPEQAAVSGAEPGAAMQAAIRDLARDAASLREAVARFKIAPPPVDVVLPEDAPLFDTLVAAQAREQRVRDDAVELTRGLARITTQSALLLVKFTDSAAAFVQRIPEPAPPPAAEARPARSPWMLAGVGLAGIAAVASVLALWQARESAARLDRMQQTLTQSIGERAEAQETALRTLEARMRELTSREAALVAAIAAATAPPPPIVPVEAVPHPPPKTAASAKNAKRNRPAPR